MTENENAEGNGYEPLAITDEYMQRLFDGIAEHKDFKPYKSELEQFFLSRIWRIIEEEAKPILAGMYISLAQKGPMSEVERAEIASAINIMRYWMNLENNLFAARVKGTSLSAEQVGGESWKAQPD